MQVLKGHRRVVHSVAFAPDGRSLASGSGDRSVRLWDLAAGESRVVSDAHGVMANKVAFSPDGRWLATVHNHRVRVYDLKTGKEAHVLGEDDPSGCAQGIAFSADGKRFAAGGVSGPWTRWRLWTPGKWQEVPAPPIASKIVAVCNLAFAPDGCTLAVLGYGELLLCDLKTGRLLASCSVKMSGTSPIMPLAFAPDGSLLVFGHTSWLMVWDMRAQRAVGELHLPKKHFQDAAFSPDGRVLATVSNEETVKYWDARSGKERRCFAWDVGKLKCIAFAPDGMRAAAGGDKGKIVVWDVDE
jgi:WD40 repeat protein